MFLNLTAHRLPKGPNAAPTLKVKFPIDPATLAEIDLAAAQLGMGRAEFVRAAARAVAAEALSEAA